jgi:hypothetical protein
LEGDIVDTGEFWQDDLGNIAAGEWLDNTVESVADWANEQVQDWLIAQAPEEDQNALEFIQDLGNSAADQISNTVENFETDVGEWLDNTVENISNIGETIEGFWDEQFQTINQGFDDLSL